MNHQDHVNLIRNGVPANAPKPTPAIWADFGSGTGAFTLALADVLGPGARIISVDRDAGALREQQRRLTEHFPAASVEYLAADFTAPLALPPLDGIVMANALHFVEPDRKPAVVQRLRSYLRPGGRLVLVEYNADAGNPWVPYPMSFPAWQKLAVASGFVETRLLATIPSRFLREIFSAVSLSPPAEATDRLDMR